MRLQSFKGFRGFRGFKGFKRLGAVRGWQTAGLDAHKKPLMWPWGACWLRTPGERRGWAIRNAFAEF